ncbi:hypothetical protein DFJ74DRAFT_663514 [Hyaloraphidium curvatum]|nr:hypothetical protein DFJ74DRAFT_663514 [Hyaloraphidium curvatum]
MADSSSPRPVESVTALLGSNLLAGNDLQQDGHSGHGRRGLDQRAQELVLETVGLLHSEEPQELHRLRAIEPAHGGLGILVRSQLGHRHHARDQARLGLRQAAIELLQHLWSGAPERRPRVLRDKERRRLTELQEKPVEDVLGLSPLASRMRGKLERQDLEPGHDPIDERGERVHDLVLHLERREKGVLDDRAPRVPSAGEAGDDHELLYASKQDGQDHRLGKEKRQPLRSLAKLIQEMRLCRRDAQPGGTLLVEVFAPAHVVQNAADGLNPELLDVGRVQRVASPTEDPPPEVRGQLEDRQEDLPKPG